MTTTGDIGPAPMVKVGDINRRSKKPKKIKKFSKFLEDDMNEAILIPDLPKIKSIEKDDLKLQFPDIIFYEETSKKCGGYKEGKISINLNCIKKPEDLYIFVYHESIHKLQDKKSVENIFDIIKKGRIRIGTKELMQTYNLTNKFEIMAYASTFAIMLKINMLPLKGYNLFFEESPMGKVYEEIKKSNNYKTFKKYLYLYYENIEIPENILKDIIIESKDKKLNERFALIFSGLESFNL